MRASPGFEGALAETTSLLSELTRGAGVVLTSKIDAPARFLPMARAVVRLRRRDDRVELPQLLLVGRELRHDADRLALDRAPARVEVGLVLLDRLAVRRDGAACPPDLLLLRHDDGLRAFA